MEIDRALYPIHSLGPGERLVIWCIGCSKRCHNCANPELWEKNSQKDVNVLTFISELKRVLKERRVDGVTITGGDPMEQLGELMLLLKECANLTDDVLLYTGYTYKECEELFGKSTMEELNKYVSVFIDGRYIDEKNKDDCILRGSGNQIVRFLNPGMRERYEAYMKAGRRIQNVIYQQKLISVGIHNKDF